jgi:nitroreductase
MKNNPVIQTLLEHKSIRKYSSEIPSQEVVETIVKAGQQAPFSSQLYSILICRDQKHNPYKAPLLFTLCIDSHKFELIMAKRGWKLIVNDLFLLLLGIQDVALMAQNMNIAGRSLGLGSCLLGLAPYKADKIAETYDLPQRVFPLVQMVMGYPTENPPPRPRYPMTFTLFENKYPKLDEKAITEAMKQMDEGFINQNYYRNLQAKIPLRGNRKEKFTYTNYSWTEHHCRKLGQWFPNPKALIIQFTKRGFNITQEKQ